MSKEHKKSKLSMHEGRYIWPRKTMKKKTSMRFALYWSAMRSDPECHHILFYPLDWDKTWYLSSAWIMSDWNLYMSCACWHSLCDFVCASIVLNLEDTASLCSSISSVSYNLFLRFEGNGLIKIPHFVPSLPKPVTLWQLSNCGPLIIFIYCKKKLLCGGIE